MAKNGKLVKIVQTEIPLTQNLQVPCGSENHILNENSPKIPNLSPKNEIIFFSCFTNSSTNAPTNQDNNPRSETPVTESTSGSHQAGHSKHPPKNAQSMELLAQDSQTPSTSGANKDGDKSHYVLDEASTQIGDIQLEATQKDVTQGGATEQSSVAKSTSAGSIASSKASIADEMSEAEFVQKRTPATVRRRTPKNTPKQQEIRRSHGQLPSKTEAEVISREGN